MSMHTLPVREPSARRVSRLGHSLADDADLLRLPRHPAHPAPAADLTGLPDPVRQYLRFMGVPGRPPDWSFAAHCTGRFRLRPGWPWLPCTVWQYNSGVTVARIFRMRIGGPVPMQARDSYLGGRGRMFGTLFGLVPVAGGSGPEYDMSGLVTYLNDAVFCAPSMLLGLPVTWMAAGDRCFDVTLRDSGLQVTARVFLDERGAPVDFSTDDRWCDLPSGLARVRWTTPVHGCRQAGGRWQPTRGTAIWHLPGGEFSYAEFFFRPGGIRYNVAPDRLDEIAAESPES
jgi:hypothetical protein